MYLPNSSFSNLTPGQEAQIRLEVGPTYDRIDLIMKAGVGANAPANVPIDKWGDYIEWISLKPSSSAFGVEHIFNKVPADVFVKIALNYRRYEMTAGILPIFFQRLHALTPADEDATRLGTVGLESLTLTVKLKTGITIERFESASKISGRRNYGPHMRLVEHIMDNTSQGDVEFTDMPKGPYGLMALHCDTDAMDRVRIRVNNSDIYDMDALQRTADAKYRECSPQAGMTHIDMQQAGRMAEQLNMNVSSFRARFDRTATGSFKIYAEVLHIPGVS
jgi:hypothetical protein